MLFLNCLQRLLSIPDDRPLANESVYLVIHMHLRKARLFDLFMIKLLHSNYFVLTPGNMSTRHKYDVQ